MYLTDIFECFMVVKGFRCLMYVVYSISILIVNVCKFCVRCGLVCASRIISIVSFTEKPNRVCILQSLRDPDTITLWNSIRVVSIQSLNFWLIHNNFDRKWKLQSLCFTDSVVRCVLSWNFLSFAIWNWKI